MMQPESLVQLVGSGNVNTLEQEWNSLLEGKAASVENLLRYQPVLVELVRVGKTSVAETLAWTALEALSSAVGAASLLELARSFVLAVPDSAELRTQVAEIYRQNFGQRAGFDSLLTQAGLISGRPVRRALRILDVCLAVQPGGYLAGRDEDTCAQVVSVDSNSWQVTIQTPGGQEILGPVDLSDRFRLADRDEFRILQAFRPTELKYKLENDPVLVIRELCDRHGGKITEERLEELLIPATLTPAEWKKWWSRAKTALKKCPDISVSGKAPVTIQLAAPISSEQDLLADLRRLDEPAKLFDRINRYLAECRARGIVASSEALAQSRRWAQQRAQEQMHKQEASAGAYLLLAKWIAQESGQPADDHQLQVFLRSARDPVTVLAGIETEKLLQLALEALPLARPQDWREVLKSALPLLAPAACERVAVRLRDAGTSVEEFEPVLQKILSNPIAHFDALLWLWSGSSDPQLAAIYSPTSLLTKIIRTLDGARRRDAVSKDTIRKLGVHARSVLSARNYERFKASIKEIDPGLAAVLRNQIAGLEVLGRAVRDDLLELLRPHVPAREEAPEVENWAREDVIYVTEAGMARKRAEIDHLVNVKMKENARAIGAAAEHGDLSENSEYKFALEERDLLRARLAQMNAEMAMAKVLSPAEVPTDYVGIGSRVVFRRLSDGSCQELTFLGPWDADLDRNIVNYKAPLAQAVMGKKVGDQVDLETRTASGRYEIVEIHNGLADRTVSAGVLAAQTG